jgi:hypothetical protein
MALEQRYDFSEISIQPKTEKFASIAHTHTDNNGYSNGHANENGHAKDIKVNGQH